MNKYVGYKSQNLTIGLEKVTASVKMLALNEGGQLSGFPNRELMIERHRGVLTVVEDSLFTENTETFCGEDLLAVRCVQSPMD